MDSLVITLHLNCQNEFITHCCHSAHSFTFRDVDLFGIYVHHKRISTILSHSYKILSQFRLQLIYLLTFMILCSEECHSLLLNITLLNIFVSVTAKFNIVYSYMFCGTAFVECFHDGIDA